jgi:hypothetical protein
MVARRLRTIAALFVAPVAAARCGQDAPTPPATEASQIIIYAGDNQTWPSGSILPSALAVRVTGDGERGVPGTPIEWHVTSGGGELLSGSAGGFRPLPDAQPFTVSDAQGVARVYFRPTAIGTSTVVASTVGPQLAPVTFTAKATTPIAVVVNFGPIFDCTPFTDPSTFTGPDNSSDVVVDVGAPVEWVYAPWLNPVCTARVSSTSTPPGGDRIDSGIIGPGAHFSFVPNVAGTWEYVDAVNGGRGTLTARMSPAPVARRARF